MKVSKRSLSRRIQKWTFGKNTPYANNLCAHFWKTVFAVCLLPVIGVAYAVVLPPVFLISWTVDAVRNKLEVRRSTLYKRGKTLTVEQAYELANSIGLIRNGCFEWRDAMRRSNKKAIMLHGWMAKYAGNSINQKMPDAVMLIEEYIKNLNIRETHASKKDFFAKIIKAIFSYLPVVYMTTTIAGALFIIVMSSGYFFSIDATNAGLIIGPLLGYVWVFIVTRMHGHINRLASKYGEPLEDDIFISYIKSVKDKVCPLIEWTE